MPAKKTAPVIKAAPVFPKPKTDHRSVTPARAKEIGKDRVSVYVGDWFRDLSDEVAVKAGDKSRNALAERLLVEEADRVGVKVPERARAEVKKL